MSSNDNPTFGPAANVSYQNWLSRHQEASCIETPVILDCLQMRESITRNVALPPSPDNDHPIIRFKGADHFKITDLIVLTNIPIKSNEKKVKLLIIIRYDLLYTDGENELVQTDNACFELSIDKIKCPHCIVKRFQKKYIGNYSSVSYNEKLFFSAEALAQTFGEVICSYTGALIIDLGVFFIIKSICIIDLLVPTIQDCIQYREQKEAYIRETDEKRYYY